MTRSRSVTACGVVLLFLLSVCAYPLVVVPAQPSTLTQAGPRSPVGPDIGTYLCSSTSPCPMGVADYGVNKKTTYSYVAEVFSSWTNFTKLSIGGDHKMMIQLNVVDYKVYENGAAGEYWIQDIPVVVQTTPGHYSIQQLDNIWNFSSSTAKMGGTIYPNQNGGCSSTGGLPSYYYCYGQTFATTLPFEVQLTVQTGLAAAGTHKGDSVVTFGIHVYHSGKVVGGSQFDAVAFAGAAALPARFTVGGSNPYGLTNDAETILGGDCCSSTVVISSISAQISESYSASIGGALVLVPHAWSTGNDTSETVSGVHIKSTVAGKGIAVSGTDNNVQLW